MARAKVVLPVVAGVALLVGLWVVARSGVSSEQRLADAQPPAAAVAEAELEERVLEDVVPVRGRVEVQAELAVRGPAPTEGRAVVVDLPVEVGETVANGGVVAVVADRPVLVLEMPVPLWRTLQPGDEGPDVERFQRALSALGYDVHADGEFGPVTQSAVRQWYQDRGFEPLEVPLEDDSAAEDPSSEEADGSESDGPVQGDGEGGSPPEGYDVPDAGAEGPEGETAAGTEAGSGVALASAATVAQDDEPEMGVVVPLGEVVGVRALPATVTDLPAEVGSEVMESPVAVLSPSENVIRAEVEPGRADLLTPGTTGTAEIDGEAESYAVEVVPEDGDPDIDAGDAMGDEAMGGDSPAGGGDDAFGPRTVVFASAVELGSDLVGTSVRVDVTVASTDDAVLAAPIAAIRTDADGDYLLLPADDDGDEPVRVGITAGNSIGGWVEVTEPDRDLDAGLTVLLGG